MENPPKPTASAISEQLREWRTLENYKLQEKSLTLLFQKFSPRNTRLDHVLLKVSALNDFYSTNIYDTYTVAKHIHSLRIDSRLRKPDLSLVNEIALVSKNGKVRNHYSFASKYCNHHFPENYPIYDSFVEKMLWHYAKTDKFSVFRRTDFKDYETFVGIIEDFRSYYRLGRFSLRQLDIFLWLCGKASFPKQYP